MTLSPHWLGKEASALQPSQWSSVAGPRPGYADAGEGWESPDRARRGMETGRDRGRKRQGERKRERLVSGCHFPALKFLGCDFSFDYFPLSVSQDPFQVAGGEGGMNSHWNSGEQTTFKYTGCGMCDWRWAI